MPQYELDHSLSIETWRALDAFTRGYITAAMWTLTDEDGDSCDHLGLHDVADETIQTAITECADFTSANRATLDATGCDDDERHGADFWLTRNGHGAGFWDRGYGRIGDELTRAAKAHGGADWYLGDDGNVYQM